MISKVATIRLIFIIMVNIFYVHRSIATPSYVEVWFLSEPVIGNVINLLHDNDVRFSNLLAENVNPYKCIPMGEGCFHPQTGYVDKKPTILKKKIKEKEYKLKTINAVETNLINCDKKNYFDIFCGKAKKIPAVKNTNLEIWVDTSSSLRKIDYNKDINFCNRRSFISKVFNTCGREKVLVSTYDARSRKSMGDLSSLCINSGTNDEKRLIRWIKDSNAKRLLIITDIDEYRSETGDFLDSIGAKVAGGGVEKFLSSEMVDKVKDLIKLCK